MIHPRSVRLSGRRGAFTLIEILVVIAIIALLVAILFPVFSRTRENARRASCLSNLKQIGLGIAQYVQDFDETYPIDAGNDDSGNWGTVYSGLSWVGKVEPYVQSHQLFICPSAEPNPSNPAGTTREDCTSYWVPAGMFVRFTTSNDPLSFQSIRASTITRPALIPHVYENLNGYYESRRIMRPNWVAGQLTSLYESNSGSFDMAKGTIHFDGISALYADGHAKWGGKADLYKAMCPEWTPANKGLPSGGCTAPSKI